MSRMRGARAASMPALLRSLMRPELPGETFLFGYAGNRSYIGVFHHAEKALSGHGIQYWRVKPIDGSLR